MKRPRSGLHNRIITLVRDHIGLLVVLAIAAIMWAFVFNEAAIQFAADGQKPLRSSWLGTGDFDIFGYTIEIYFEGWADHDYYYVSWADQFLSGYIPYTESFDNSIINGIAYDTPYFFPPLFVYMCALGGLLPIQPFGIGFIICIFGYLTAIPIYGIAEYLSGNKKIATTSAATYLFNPIVLYHTVFQWLNPAPFVFFSILSFYLLMKNHRIAGALTMVTAAMFKQTAFIFGLPLVAYLMKRAPVTEPANTDVGDSNEEGRPESDQVNLRDFAKTLSIVLAYALALSYPYILDPFNYAYSMFLKAGATRLEDISTLPASNVPITLAVVFIAFGAPEWLSEAINQIQYYGIAFLVGIVALLAMMLLEAKDDQNLQGYWRRMLFLTFLMLLWLHIFSPRGIYKYYLVVLVPFFSIISVSSMCEKSCTNIGFSPFEIISPVVLSLLLLVPHRNIYLIYLVFILVVFVLNKKISKAYGWTKSRIKRVLASH